MALFSEVGRHSSDVRLERHLEDWVLPVAQIGPDFLILRTPVDLPPSFGELKVQIDDREVRSPVHLMRGSSIGQPRTPIARVAATILSGASTDLRSLTVPGHQVIPS
jgi:hypothetical protein